MWRRIVVFLVSCFLLGTMATPVLASGPGDHYGLDVTAQHAAYTDSSGQGLTVFDAVQRVVSILLGLLAIIFFILTTYAGLRWMTSRGNEEIALEAKNILEAAVIGLVVIVSSYGITSYIFKKLEGVSTEETQITNACEAFTNQPACETATSINCFWSEVDGTCKQGTNTSSQNSTDPTGACLKVTSSGSTFSVDCTITDQSLCDPDHQFYVDKDQSFCDTQQSNASGLGAP